MCKFQNLNDLGSYYEENGILVYPMFDEIIRYPTGDPLDFTDCQTFICYGVIYKGVKYVVEPEVTPVDFGGSKKLIYHELDETATARKISDFICELMTQEDD